MRTTTIPTTALLLGLLARCAVADPVADARALGDKFATAVGSGDVKAVLALYAEDARVIYPGRGQEARGKAALRTMLERDLPTMRSIAMVQKSSDAIAIDPTHIMNVGRWETTAPGPGGRRENVVIRTTELLVNDGGTWRYLVDHASMGVPPPPAPRRGERARRR